MPIVLERIADDLRNAGADDGEDSIANEIAFLLGDPNDSDRPFWWREWVEPENENEKPKRAVSRYTSDMPYTSNSP